MKSSYFSLLLLFSAASFGIFAQSDPAADAKVATDASAYSSTTLGPGDELTLGAPDIEELDRRVLRVQADGTVSVPELGQLKAEGLTPQQFQASLTEALKTQFRNPDVSFTSIDIKSKPVSVLGAVNHPGVHQADSDRSLLEMISLAGGLRSDAGPVIKVTRNTTGASSFPPEVRPTFAGGGVTAEITVSSLFDGQNPAANITILPGDVITVPRGKFVYVVGNVRKAGGFAVGESNDFTVLKALSMAEGLESFADTAHARILKAGTNGQRVEQEFDLKKVMAGKAEDIRLDADDVLFVPNSATKKWTARAIEAAVNAGVGYAVWR